SWSAGVSRASLFDVDDLARSQVDGSLERGALALRIDYAELSSPGARETSARIDLRESAARSVALALRAERLSFRAWDSSAWGGWALGVLARAEPGRGFSTWIGVDRALRSAALRNAGVPASL